MRIRLKRKLFRNGFMHQPGDAIEISSEEQPPHDAEILDQPPRVEPTKNSPRRDDTRNPNDLAGGFDPLRIQKIQAVIRKLDENDDTLWTTTDKPQVEAIETVLKTDTSEGAFHSISAAERDTAWEMMPRGK